MKTTGEIIADLLTRQGKTQLQLAEYLVKDEVDKDGLPKPPRPATVNDWIKKGKIPKGKNLLKVAEFFGVSTDVILGNFLLEPQTDIELLQDSDFIVDMIQTESFVTDRLIKWGYYIKKDDDFEEKNEITIIRKADGEERQFTNQEFIHWLRHMKKLIEAVDSGFEDFF